MSIQDPKIAPAFQPLALAPNAQVSASEIRRKIDSYLRESPGEWQRHFEKTIRRIGH
jgi:hypothetical protein